MSWSELDESGKYKKTAMKNIIITLLVLLLSLTSCKEKEDMNKKYHWVAYVKPVAGYPVVTYIL